MKTAVITGGGGGLGKAISKAAAAEGYRVGVLDYNLETAEAVAAELDNAVAFQVDVRDEASVEAALDGFGDVPDLLVNNAGIAIFKPLIEQTPEDFQAVIDVNLVACFTVGRCVAKRMIPRGSGAIVNITSINGITPAPGVGAYPAAKAGLASLTEHMAVEWGPEGLRINAIAPGFIDAGMSSPFFENPVVRELRGKAPPTKRLGQADDIANAVMFLASEKASYINGHQIVVDGGVTRSLLAQLPREID